MKVCGIDVCFCGEKCQNKVKSASADEQREMVFGKGFDKAFKVKREKKSDIGLMVTRKGPFPGPVDGRFAPFGRCAAVLRHQGAAAVTGLWITPLGSGFGGDSSPNLSGAVEESCPIQADNPAA